MVEILCGKVEAKRPVPAPGIESYISLTTGHGGQKRSLPPLTHTKVCGVAKGHRGSRSPQQSLSVQDTQQKATPTITTTSLGLYHHTHHTPHAS